MKQNSILSYFQRTPKAAASTANGNSNETKTGGDCKEKSSTPTPRSNGDGNSLLGKNVKTPSTSSKTPVSVRGSEDGPGAGSTPVSSRKSEQKRRPKVDESVTDSAKKRPRVEDSQSPPGKEDFLSGALVWAKLDGYPWWPAMVRGEQKNSVPHRKGRSEYHVQFFDKPPSRAWIRKSDIKKYEGSTDGAVPPAKSDPNWLECCKYADGVLGVSPSKRFDRYWVEFPELDEMDEEEEETVVTPVNKQARKRRRVQLIDDSSDEDKEIKKSNGIKNKLKKEVNGSPGSDQDYQAASSSSSSESEHDIVKEEESDVVSDASVESPEEKLTTKRKNGKNPRKSLVSRTVERVKNNLPYRLSPSGAPGTPPSVQGSPNSSMRSPNVSVSSPRPSGGKVEAEDGKEKWMHTTLDFLKPENMVDANRNKPEKPEYDPKTLYVPMSFKEKCTPAQRQWWEMKGSHFDTVLFFKVGKFYELYHMDAVAAVQELGIDFMRGEIAHCGFPEIAFSKFSSVLVERGYKVARIEQTETPEIMNDRCRKMSKATKFDRVVKREICQVTTKGVKVATIQDQAREALNSDSSYLFAITEKPVKNGLSEVGVCFLDTTIGKFRIGQFRDDRIFSRLRTVFSHYNPAEILLEKGKLSAGIQNLVSVMTSVRKNALEPDKEFWNEKKTLKVLNEEKYFWNENLERNVFPENFKQFLSKSDHLCLTAEDGCELGIKSFGAVIWYLKHCLVDFDLLSMKDFELYQPVDAIDCSTDMDVTRVSQRNPKNLILDGTTLKNLNVTFGHTNLLAEIDYCSTLFGRRLLRSWVCMPLARPEEITRRLDAVEDLVRMKELTASTIPMLKSLPDLERLMSKVHTLGSEHRGKHHPDSRAFFFEETKYSRRKVADLITVLEGFKSCAKIVNSFRACIDELQSDLLLSLLDSFPVLDELLNFFDNAFDHKQAAKDGKIIPNAGVDIEYDSVCQWQEDIITESNSYLREMEKKLQTKVSWFGSDKKRFQLEVGDKVRVPHNFEMSSSRKGFKRYSNDDTKKFLERITKMEVSREGILKTLIRRVFEKVDSHRDTWSQATNIVAELDSLISLARYCEAHENMCRPKIVYSSEPFIDVEDGRHPCVVQDSYVANSSTLGTSSAEAGDQSKGVFSLLTGPNMGGKSTLMRQMGLLSVLAHIGSFVPASKFEMSVIDRIFTRVGANDNINDGESTFFVEMNETSTILKHSTRDSLVLMDELGRGTATHDGTAIAYAATKNLVNRGCRSYFSTHYHNLVEAVNHMPSIQLGHMACAVENENEEDPTEETVTFLYKLVPGACPKSYGFNAAKIAGLPNDIILVAHKKARQLELQNSNTDVFRKILSLKNLSLKDAKDLDIQ